MKEALEITEVTFCAASGELVNDGLVGWVSFAIGGQFRLEGLMLRRTLDGRRVLSYPSRPDNHGRHHDYIVPHNDEVRRRVEREVFRALGYQEEEGERP